MASLEESHGPCDNRYNSLLTYHVISYKVHKWLSVVYSQRCSLERSKVQCTTFTFLAGVGVTVWDVPQSCHQTAMVREPLWRPGRYSEVGYQQRFAGGTIGQTGCKLKCVLFQDPVDPVLEEAVLPNKNFTVQKFLICCFRLNRFFLVCKEKLYLH